MSKLDAVLAELGRLANQAETLPTAEQRAVVGLEAYEYARTTVLPELANARRRAVRELRATGYSLKECAQILGVTEARISQITGA